MDVGLPRETQQIDRVVEAFAARYVQCNPNLFSSDGESILGLHFWTPLIICVFDIDHPYILAFSLIMLHTDAFNKSNKRKMTKQDYIKNTRLPGVAPEVLDVSPSSVIPETILYPCAGDGIFECLLSPVVLLVTSESLLLIGIYVRRGLRWLGPRSIFNH